MRQFWDRFPIKVSMVFLFLGISLLSMILMGLFSHFNYSSTVMKDFHTVTDEATKRLHHHIEFYFEQLSKTTKTVVKEEQIQRWFEDGESISIFDAEDIEAMLRRYVALNYNEIAGIFLMSTDNRVLAMRSYSSSVESYISEPWYAVPLSGQRVLIPTHMIKYPQQNGLSVISILNPVYSSTTLSQIGYIVMDLSLSEIEATFERSKLGQTGQFMLLSQDNTIVYHRVKEWRGRKLAETPMSSQIEIPAEGGVNIQAIDGKSMLVSTSSSKVLGWRVVAVVPFDEMASGLYSARNSTIVAFGLIAILVMFLIPLVSNLFVKPVLHLKQNMNRVFQGDYNTRAEFRNGKNEFQILNYSFNKMVEQLDEQVHTISELKLQEVHMRLRQKEAYIQALQNQINPHLLYNSLDVIKSIGYINNDELVVSMATNLADVYRYTAKFSDHEVTLREELTILEKYLEITHIRFPKFQSRITVNPKFYDCLLVKLTAQPLVENAVKYVVEPRAGAAAILVSAFDDKDDLVIEIADNGPGIPELKLDELTQGLKDISRRVNDQEFIQSESLGIRNVHTRLFLKYGEGYGLTLSSFPDRGTVISIRIPLKYK